MAFCAACAGGRAKVFGLAFRSMLLTIPWRSEHQSCALQAVGTDTRLGLLSSDRFSRFMFELLQPVAQDSPASNGQRTLLLSVFLLLIAYVIALRRLACCLIKMDLQVL